MTSKKKLKEASKNVETWCVCITWLLLMAAVWVPVVRWKLFSSAILVFVLALLMDLARRDLK